MRERPDVTARCVKRTGWHGDVFVLPRETFGDTDAEPVLFQSATLDGVALGQGGTLEGWRREVAARCAGQSRLVLAICAGFAGPCLGLLGMDGGGFHLRGGSSTGKSTALRVAASLLGPPCYARTWRQTDNALEGVAELHSDLLLILDEMGQLDPKHAGQVAYLLANGQGKGRASRDGSPRARATWRILFLSAGEIGLCDLVTQSGGKVRAGQEVRVIDLPADAGVGLGLLDHAPPGESPGAFADALKAASAKHHGHALPAFLRALAAAPAKAREALALMRDGLTNELAGPNADGQVRRVAERFALVAAAGELATAYRLTGWQTGEAQSAARACFTAWLAGRGTKGAAEPSAMLEQVRAFLSAHGESRFTDWEKQRIETRTINRAGYRRQGEDGPTFYVEPEVFKREVCAGFDPRTVAKVLADAGALKLAGDGRGSTKTTLPDKRNTRVYVITPALWAEA
jgi:putative DNA primase/helicase